MSVMQMFTWESDLLEDAYPGTIVVMANSIENARAVAVDHLREYLSEGCPCHACGQQTPPTPEVYQRGLDSLMLDLAEEPELGPVLFITGSG